MEELNFSVKPMLDAFDFETFLRNRGSSDKHSAFFLITKKQLLCGFTNKNGSKYHLTSFANALREIYDMPLFKSTNEQVLLEDRIESSFITGRFISDAEIGVFLAFYLQELKCISSEEFKLFEYFYEKYNDVIDYYSNQYKTPLVFASLPKNRKYIDEYGNEVDLINSDNLDCIYDHLKSIISPKRELMDDKKIIGISLEEVKEMN